MIGRATLMDIIEIFSASAIYCSAAKCTYYYDEVDE